MERSSMEGNSFWPHRGNSHFYGMTSIAQRYTLQARLRLNFAAIVDDLVLARTVRATFGGNYFVVHSDGSSSTSHVRDEPYTQRIDIRAALQYELTYLVLHTWGMEMCELVLGTDELRVEVQR